MKENDFGRILITGASRGIGFEMTKQLLEMDKLEKIYATTRKKNKNLDQLKENYKK